ncbi:MAG: hypothetical protein ONB25_04660 [candidate division KSB1 bacterium]|nr:hypothetical protein [candidate division KSB1 bacterium]
MRRERYMLILHAAGVTLLVAHCVQAQPREVIPQLGGMRTPSSVLFRQDLNAYAWIYDLGAQARTGRLHFGARERFQSSMLRLGPGGDKWKDDQHLEAFARWHLSPHLLLSVRVLSSALSDRQSGYRNDVRTELVESSARANLSQRAWAEASFGGKRDLLFGHDDRGLCYGSRLGIERAVLAGYENTLQFEYGGDRFPVRKNQDLALTYGVHREFVPGTSDSLRVSFSTRRRDNYFSAAGEVETYQERPAAIENHLSYRLMEGMDLDLENAARYREVEVALRDGDKLRDHRRRQDQEFEHWLRLSFTRGGLGWRTRLGYWAQDQRYDMPATQAPSPFSPRAAFVTPANYSSRLSLVNEVGFRMGAADSLASRLSMSLLRYDTPDTNNFDDRDELRIAASLLVEHLFSAGLKLQVMASVNLYHIVYLFAERSADNNWNRVFRFTTRGFYLPSPRILFYQSFEVLANYVAYDYEQVFEETRSFVFRKFVADDSLSWQASERSRIYGESRLLVEENGRLYWDEWAERPLMSRTSLWVRLAWKYRLTSTMEIAPGFLYYRRQGWRHSLDSQGKWRQEEYEHHWSRGPVLSLTYGGPSGVRFEMRAARRRVNSTGQAPQTLNSVDLGLTWLF